MYVRRQVTRHGKIVYYFRRQRSGKRIRLPDPSDSAFNSAYAKAFSGTPQRPISARSGSLSWLIGRYKESAQWANLKPSTRRMRDNILKHVIEAAGEESYAQITRRHINEGIDRRLPHAGNNFRKVMSQLFKWAVSIELVEINPADGANRNQINSDGFHTWTVGEVEQFWHRWPVGTRERLAMDLILFTGLRRSDVYRLGRQHVTDGLISIKTEKTGIVVQVDIFPILRRSIDAAPTGDLTFLVTTFSRPFASAESFGNWFGKICKAAGVPGRAHGLRKAGATIAAEAGATAHELLGMYDWKRLSQAEVYTQAANRKRLARGSAERIANAFAPHLEPKRASPDKKS